MIALGISLVCMLLVLVTAWLVGPTVRAALEDRRRLQLMKAEMVAEQHIRAATQAAMGAMREAVRQHVRETR